MNRIIRRSMIGILAGGVASAALIATAGHVGLSLLLGATIGAAFAASTGQTPGAYLDNMMTAFGVKGFALRMITVLFGSAVDWNA